MKLKYEEKIANFTPCPQKSASINGELIAYRFAHFPCNLAGNFLPIAIMNPSRIIGKSNGHCCSSYGLSMFNSLEQLTEKIKVIEEFTPLVRQTLGSYWVSVKIDKSSGIITPANKEGHFNLHEYVDFKGEESVSAWGEIN